MLGLPEMQNMEKRAPKKSCSSGGLVITVSQLPQMVLTSTCQSLDPSARLASPVKHELLRAPADGTELALTL